MSLKIVTEIYCSILTELSDKFDMHLTKLLISEYKARLEQFSDNKTRADTLYKEIMRKFHAKGYTNVSAEHCSRRMAYLANEFKRRYDMVTRLTGSGGEPIRWDYYDMMGQLLEKSVTIEPQGLLNFGSSNSHSVRAYQEPAKRNARKRPLSSTAMPQPSNQCSLAEYRMLKLDLGRRMVSSAEKLASTIAPNVNDSDED